jgi:predicted regulator of Ras-like GTPase activity (Roadblock/LC7/MglB family)
LTFTFVVAPLIKTVSKYGASGIKHIDGLVMVSGMPLYTLAAIVKELFSMVCGLLIQYSLAHRFNIKKRA